MQSRLKSFGQTESVIFPAHKMLDGDPSLLANM